VLILGYLTETGKLTPEASMKLEQAINLGYQRLCTFEVSGGGFDWYGRAPANVLLSAYGILELSDMNRVYPIDLGIVERAKAWLAGKQQENGSWHEEHLPYSLGVTSADLMVTAYVAWALAEAGDRSPMTERALAIVERGLRDGMDTYTLALAANALLARDPKHPAGRACVEKLLASAQEEDHALHWVKEGRTMYYGGGEAGNVELTALVALALARLPSESARWFQALTWLVRHKDPQGGWHSTQATILAMKALLGGSTPKTASARAVVSLTVNGRPAGTLEVTSQNSDLLQQVDLKEHVQRGANRVELAVAGEAPMSYQIAGRWYVPWAGVPAPVKPPVEIDVAYDKTTLAVDDTVDCTVRVRYHLDSPTYMVIVDVGIPPGFTPDPGSLAELVGQGKVDKYSQTGRQLTFYLGQVSREKPVELRYACKARFPIRAQAPESTAYEYYNPANRATAKPVRLEVR